MLGIMFPDIIISPFIFVVPCTNKRPPNETSDPTKTRELKLESTTETIPDVAVIVPCIVDVPCTNKRPPNETSEPTKILELKLES